MKKDTITLLNEFRKLGLKVSICDLEQIGWNWRSIVKVLLYVLPALQVKYLEILLQVSMNRPRRLSNGIKKYLATTSILNYRGTRLLLPEQIMKHTNFRRLLTQR